MKEHTITLHNQSIENMADSDTTIELLRDVRAILRDTARAAAVQAELTAVAHDRLGRALEDNDRMKDILTRIDSFLTAAEHAKSLAKANADLKEVEDRTSILKLLDHFTSAMSSPLGQRVLMLLGYLLLGWLGLRFGVVTPGPAVTKSENPQIESTVIGYPAERDNAHAE